MLGKSILALCIVIFLPGRINLPQELFWYLGNQNIVVIAIMCLYEIADNIFFQITLAMVVFDVVRNISFSPLLFLIK